MMGDMSELSEQMVPWNQGFSACVNEGAFDDCPYPKGTREYDLWMDGWRCGHGEL